MNKEITFDRFIRGMMVTVGCILGYLLLRRLSGALLPFFVAWLLAYLLYPLVLFLQRRLHLRYRVPCIIIALGLVIAFVTGLLLLIIPPAIEQTSVLRGSIVQLINDIGQSPLASEVDQYIHENFDENTVTKLMQNHDVVSVVQVGFAKLWDVLTNAFTIVEGVVSSLLVILYLFFILMDYEQITSGFARIVPQQYRGVSHRLFRDVENGMNAYFRGQALIAFLVGVLLSIGFSIIGLPMAVGLGMFIGVLNLVPYLQVLGLLPTCLLAFLYSMQTGESFWVIMLYSAIVILVVQIIQDLILTPRIMGKMMGLKPAIILLALSIWGSLLGFIGLIIALPLTTLIISYYRIFVLKEEDGPSGSDESLDQ